MAALQEHERFIREFSVTERKHCRRFSGSVLEVLNVFVKKKRLNIEELFQMDN